jgi:hypothetical protein
MTIHAHTLVAQLVAHHPYTEDVFAWHDVPLDDRHRSMSLYALCWVRGLELQTLLSEIEAAIAAEEEPTEELTADEWTDEQIRQKSVEDRESWEWGDYFAVEAPDLQHGAAK